MDPASQGAGFGVSSARCNSQIGVVSLDPQIGIVSLDPMACYTGQHLHAFLASKQEETRLALLREALDDPEARARVFWEDQNAQRILANEYEDGTFGRFLQNALRRYPPSQDT
jgi:hypothetical protein